MRSADVGKGYQRPIAKGIEPFQLGLRSQVEVFQADNHLLAFAPKMYKVELRACLKRVGKERTRRGRALCRPCSPINQGHRRDRALCQPCSPINQGHRLRRKGLLATRVGARLDPYGNRSTPFQTVSERGILSPQEALKASV